MMEVNISRFVFFLIFPVLVSIPDWFEIPIAADEFWGTLAGAKPPGVQPGGASSSGANEPTACRWAVHSAGDDYSDSPEEYTLVMTNIAIENGHL